MLSAATEAKLDAWLRPGTWHTLHDNDMDRWYDFVDQYQRDHGFTIDEPALRELIEHRIGADIDEELGETIQGRISLAYRVLDFLKRTGR